MRTESQTAGGGGGLKKKNFRAVWKCLISFLLKPVTSDPWAHLMLRRSHPRMAVSLAVASWVLLWWGLHLPEVNFSCPLPSKVALLEIWGGKSIHTHLNQWLHIHQKALDSLYPVQDGLRAETAHHWTRPKGWNCSYWCESKRQGSCCEIETILFTFSLKPQWQELLCIFGVLGGFSRMFYGWATMKKYSKCSLKHHLSY